MRNEHDGVCGGDVNGLKVCLTVYGFSFYIFGYICLRSVVIEYILWYQTCSCLFSLICMLTVESYLKG